MRSKWDEAKPVDDAMLEGWISAARDRAQEHFDTNALGDRDRNFARQLHQKIEAEKKRLLDSNAVCVCVLYACMSVCHRT